MEDALDDRPSALGSRRVLPIPSSRRDESRKIAGVPLGPHRRPGDRGGTGLAGALVQGSFSTLIVHTLQSAAPGPAGKLLTQAVVQAHQAGASHRYTPLVIGLVAVLASGTMLMGQLERGLNRVYGIERDRSTLRKYARAFVLTISAGSLIAVAFLTLAIGRSIADSLGSSTSVQIWNVIRWPLGLLLAMTAIALLFRWSPARRQPAWSWLAFGSFVAVTLWALATVGLGLFFRFSSTFGQTYGPLAGIIALALWSFLTSVALLYGGAIRRSWRRSGPARRFLASSSSARRWQPPCVSPAQVAFWNG